MIEDIAGVEAESQASRFADPDFLLQVGIEIPAAGSIDRIQAERAQLSGRGILQDDVLACSVGRDRGVAAERREN